MMIDQRAIRRASVIAIIAPLLFAGAVRIVQPSPLPGPSTASADEDQADDAHRSHKRAKVTDEQREAAAFLESVAEEPEVRNVFLYPKVQEQRIDITPVRPKDPVFVTPDFELTSIMKTRRGDVALINGRLRHIGDEAAPGWTVSAIDPLGRAVTIDGPDARTVTIKMPTGIGH